MLHGIVFYVHALCPISFGSLGPQENFSTCDFPETLSLWIPEVKQFNFSSSFNFYFYFNCKDFVLIDLHDKVYIFSLTFFALAKLNI